MPFAKRKIYSESNGMIPIGSLIWYFGKQADIDNFPNWLIADGKEVNADDYPDLEGIFTKTPGTNGGYVYTLPNLIGSDNDDGRYIFGSRTANRTLEDALPPLGKNSDGTIGTVRGFEGQGLSTSRGISSSNNAFTVQNGQKSGGHYDSGGYVVSSFTLKIPTDIYGKSNRVRPRSITAIPLIKVK